MSCVGVVLFVKDFLKEKISQDADLGESDLHKAALILRLQNSVHILRQPEEGTPSGSNAIGEGVITLSGPGSGPGGSFYFFGKKKARPIPYWSSRRCL